MGKPVQMRNETFPISGRKLIIYSLESSAKGKQNFPARERLTVWVRGEADIDGKD